MSDGRTHETHLEPGISPLMYMPAALAASLPGQGRWTGSKAQAQTESDEHLEPAEATR